MELINKLNSKFSQIKKRNKKKNIDIIVRTFFLLSTVISASFILIIIGFISMKGIIPFITDNGGIGSVNFIRFLTGSVWLTGTAFQSNLYSVGFIIINTLYIALLSLMLSLPIGVLTALFIAKVAPKRIAELLKALKKSMRKS